MHTQLQRNRPMPIGKSGGVPAATAAASAVVTDAGCRCALDDVIAPLPIKRITYSDERVLHTHVIVSFLYNNNQYVCQGYYVLPRFVCLSVSKIAQKCHNIAFA